MGPAIVAGSVLVATAAVHFRVALLPEFGTDLGMSTVQMGMVATLFAVGRLLADLPGGHLADRVAARALLAASFAGIAAGSLLLGISTTAALVLVASFLMGLSSSVTLATGMSYFSTVGGAEARGTSMSVFSAGLLGGQALGPAAAGLLAAAWGWRAALLAAGVAAVVIGVALVLGRQSGRRTMWTSPPPGPPVAGGASDPSRGGMAVLMSVSFVAFLTLGSIPQTLVPIIGARELELGVGAIGMALGAGGVARLVGALLGGRISDRVSRKALVPGLALHAAGVGVLAVNVSIPSWLASIVVMSLASFAIPVAATILGDLAATDRVGAQLGRFRFAGDLGLIVGPLAVVSIYDRVGRPAAILATGGLLLVVAALAAWFVPETRARRAGVIGGRPAALATGPDG